MRKNVFLFFIFTIPMIIMKTFSQTPERSQIDPKYIWNLNDICPNESAWLADKGIIAKQINFISSFKGKLGKSAENLYSGLKLYFDTYKKFLKFNSYAFQLRDEDLRNSSNQAKSQIASTLGSEFSQAASFISPEIVSIEPKTLKKYFRQKKELTEFKVFIDNIQRMRNHTLNANEEKILASFELVSQTPSNVYSIFNNAEMPFAELTLSNGETIRLTSSAFTKYRSTENRIDRKNIFEMFFINYGKFQNTLGANYTGKLQSDFTYAKNKKFNSALEYALSENNIPVSVYENLINQIHKNLPTLHRFLLLKKKNPSC